MSVLLINDTHIPSRAPKLPTDVRTNIRSVSHTIHAGDIGSLESLHTIQLLVNSELTAVHGDKDPAEINLATIATVQFDGVSFVVIHRAASSNDRLSRIAETVKERGGSDAIGVTGHTHEPADQVVDGVRILNPGSATGAYPAKTVSYITVTVNEGSISTSFHERDQTSAERISEYWSRLKTSLRR